MSKNKKQNKKFPFAKYTFLAAFISSLCCFAPIIFVLLGLASISTAAYWGNYFFFGYWWLFISIGLIIIMSMLIFYWRKQKVCTLDSVKRNRYRIINSILFSVSAFILFYVLLEIIWEMIWIYMGLTSFEELGKLLGF